jgi:hypothetical protein
MIERAGVLEGTARFKRVGLAVRRLTVLQVNVHDSVI